MKKIAKTLCVALSIMFFTSVFSGCKKQAMAYPDYSDSTTNFNLYAFYGPADPGHKNGNGVDFRTKERYQEYKDAGFNILLIENEAAYDGQEWETSVLHPLLLQALYHALLVSCHN